MSIEKELHILRQFTAQFSVQSFHSIKWIILIALLTAFAGELKVFPFEQIPFRIGLGSIVFFFLLLITNVRILSTGIVTALVVLLFRTTLDFLFFQQTFLDSLFQNAPAAGYYITFAFLIDRLNLRRLKEHPLQLGVLSALFEFTANGVEQLLTYILQIGSFVGLKYMPVLLLVAFLRSFFVVGIYMSITLSEQKKKLHDLFTLQTNLYTETLYMKETMQMVEQVTSDSFSLYTTLRQTAHPSSIEALRIASEIHEVKKNTQRIVSGLAQLIDEQKKSSASFMQILNHIKQANEQYARLLSKDLTINVNGDVQWHTNYYLAILSIINNVVSNAVEAIEHSGSIKIEVIEEASTITLVICNNGPMISPQDLTILFEPGFTTKFDSQGNASTGIGLYHVKSLMDSIDGTIAVESNSEWTTFTLHFNKHSI